MLIRLRLSGPEKTSLAVQTPAPNERNSVSLRKGVPLIWAACGLSGMVKLTDFLGFTYVLSLVATCVCVCVCVCVEGVCRRGIWGRGSACICVCGVWSCLSHRRDFYENAFYAPQVRRRV